MWRLLPSCYVLLYTTQTYVRWHSGQRVSYAPGANRGSFTHTHTQKNWWFKPAMHEECRFFPFYKNTKSIPRILKIQGLIYTPIRHEVAGFSSIYNKYNQVRDIRSIMWRQLPHDFGWPSALGRIIFYAISYKRIKWWISPTFASYV
jgi:hypothetical protein